MHKTLIAKTIVPKTIVLTVILLSMLTNACGQIDAEPAGWSDWDNYADTFIQEDGRVVDITFGGKTTSEGQSYALFFALVANQRSQFDTILTWTSNNLADGQLGDKLPAWLWAKRADGGWGVKDKNTASDADLWIAYTLLEAARLWDEPSYAATGQKLLTKIKHDEIINAGEAGPVLLPAPYGFVINRSQPDKRSFRINPSYLPGFMFQCLAANDPDGPWQQVWDNYIRMAPEIFKAGIAPDIFAIDSRGQVIPDTHRKPLGSYDAIRVYLWAGMSGKNSREIIDLTSTYTNLRDELGRPPEKVDPRTGVITKADFSPTGFSGAMLPLLAAVNDKPALEQELSRVESALLQAKLGKSTNYYDRVLILFGKGWLDGKYKFDEQGCLQPQWHDATVTKKETSS